MSKAKKKDLDDLKRYVDDLRRRVQALERHDHPLRSGVVETSGYFTGGPVLPVILDA